MCYSTPADFDPRRVRFRLLAASTALVLLSACNRGEVEPPIADAATQRTLTQGEVVGFAAEQHEAHVWKGIPFATPPVGPLRWRAPRPPKAWQGVREALGAGEQCPQFDMRKPGRVVGSEDCLFLDVYAPRFAADAIPADADRRPVMLWIHGGGNTVGSAEVYDGSRLAAEHDVIVVAAQYRLGVIGWLSHPALRAGAAGPEDASGNFGTLDLIRALEWVRENAAAFGGDPDNVTIFGESAGGMNVYSLLLSPRAKGLFHRAISQSGRVVDFSLADAANFFDAPEPGTTGSSGELLLALLRRDDRAQDREGAKAVLADMDAGAIEAYLRGKSADDLLAVFDASSLGGMYFSPYIFRDGHVIVDDAPLAALARLDGHNAVPTIVGTNREETKLFSIGDSPHVRRLFGLPLGIKNERLFDLGGEYGGMMWKAQGADEPAAAMRSVRDDVWAYRFDWDEEGEFLWLDFDDLLGASHAVEILFVFGFTDLGRWTDNVFADVESAEALSRQMRGYWTRFAATGDPNAASDPSVPVWRRWGVGPEDPKFMIFDSAAGGGLRMSTEDVTVWVVVDKVANDPRLENSEERCEIYRSFVEWNDLWSPAEYAQLEEGACAEFPAKEPGPMSRG